jgi:hypothetical protein
MLIPLRVRQRIFVMKCHNKLIIIIHNNKDGNVGVFFFTLYVSHPPEDRTFFNFHSMLKGQSHQLSLTFILYSNSVNVYYGTHIAACYI